MDDDDERPDWRQKMDDERRQWEADEAAQAEYQSWMVEIDRRAGMKTSEMRESKYLKKEDVGAGVLGTITGISKENVAMQGADPEYRWALHLAELDKPMVLNTTNITIIESFLGDETDNWIGRKIVLYSDPNISFQGKLVGGIRIRAPRGGRVIESPLGGVGSPPPPVQPAPRRIQPESSAIDDDIPFR